MPNGLRKGIAVSEVVGGALALLSAVLFARVGALSPLELFILGILGALSIFAGAMLWKNDVLGRRISIALQAGQVIQLQSAAMTYRVLLGAQLVVWVREGGNFGLGPGLGGLFTIGRDPNDSWWVGLNLWALAALVALMMRGAATLSAANGTRSKQTAEPSARAASESRPVA